MNSDYARGRADALREAMTIAATYIDWTGPGWDGAAKHIYDDIEALAQQPQNKPLADWTSPERKMIRQKNAEIDRHLLEIERLRAEVAALLAHGDRTNATINALQSELEKYKLNSTTDRVKQLEILYDDMKARAEKAEAALASIITPTSAMLDAGWKRANKGDVVNLSGFITDTACGEIYRAMVAEALAQKEPASD